MQESKATRATRASISVIPGLVALILLAAAAASAFDYQVDASHSEVTFKVKHLGISNITGHFEDFTASFDLDGDDLSTLKAEAVIQIKSVNTRDDDRDKHLKSADFFDAENYPEMRFVSTKAEVVGKNRVKLHGELTIRGVTRTVILDAEFSGAVRGPMGHKRAAFVASTTINRKDFGVSWNKVLDTGGLIVGDEVRIQIELEAIQKDSTTD